jgi:hypothetical protein
MRIASYHEQRGDKITFVTSEDDIRRAFDLYYIVKNKHESANPPVDFFLMHNIRWWGDAFYNRIN